MTKRERITLRAKEILASRPEGIRFSELVRRVRDSFPGWAEGNFTGAIWNLDARFPDEVYKTSQRLFRLTRFRKGEPSPVPESPRQTGKAREKTMSTLSEALETVRARIAQHKGKGMKEEDTKAALINPILGALGWEVGDLEEVRLEYKSRPQDKPVDYALMLLETPCLFVEAKALGESLEDRKWADQIVGYATVAGVEWVVLTNGHEYRIYNALARVHVVDKLFCTVCITSEHAPVEETLSLLSKEGLNGNILERLWQAYFVDRQMKPVLESLFSPDADPSFVKLLRRKVPKLATKDIKASLMRVRASFEFPVDPSKLVGKPEGITKPDLVETKGVSTKEIVYRLWVEDHNVSPEKCLERVQNRVKLTLIKWWFNQWKLGKHLPRCAKKGKPSGDVEHVNFWQPIRTEQNGLFAGKPHAGLWVRKTVRGMTLVLYLTNRDCSVLLQFKGEDREARRNKAVKLFPAPKYAYNTHESRKFAWVSFPVLDKGLKDREHWPEIREKLKLLGVKIYKALSESDV